MCCQPVFVKLLATSMACSRRILLVTSFLLKCRSGKGGAGDLLPGFTGILSLQHNQHRYKYLERCCISLRVIFFAFSFKIYSTCHSHQPRKNSFNLKPFPGSKALISLLFQKPAYVIIPRFVPLPALGIFFTLIFARVRGSTQNQRFCLTPCVLVAPSPNSCLMTGIFHRFFNSGFSNFVKTILLVLMGRRPILHRC